MKNNIHPTAIISPKAVIGNGNTIGAYTIIHDNVIIGDNNFIDSHVSIGSNGEIRDCKEFNGTVRIGSNNTIKEFVTIQIGEKGYTVIGNSCLLMSKSHIGHDSILFNNVTISTGVKVGGHCVIHDHVNIGLNAVIHQFVKIGFGAMIGMGSSVNKSIIKFHKVAGNPVRILGINYYNIKKLNLEEAKVYRDIEEALINSDETYLWKKK